MRKPNINIILNPKAKKLTAQFNSKKFSENVTEAQEQAITEITPLVKQFIRKVGGGTQYFSLRQLRKMGHPYSVRYAQDYAGIDDAIINKQTGAFYEGFEFINERVMGYRGARRIVIEVYNNNKKAAILQKGTAVMRPRAWLTYMNRKFFTDFRNRLNNTFRKNLRVTFEMNTEALSAYNEGTRLLYWYRDENGQKRSTAQDNF